jgi:hypothetical protein
MNNYLNPLFSFFNVLEARGERFSVILPREARTWSNFPKLKSYTCIQFCEPENFLKDDELLRCQTRRRSYEESYGTGRKKFRETFQKRFFPAPFFLDRGLENLIKETAPFAEVCLDLAQECLDRIQPQFIVSCRLRRVFDSAFFVAKSNALRVGVIHGLISSTPSMLFDDGSYEHQDVIFVWDDVQEQIVSLKRKNDAKIHFIKECTLKSPVHYATDRSFRLARIVLTTQTPGDLGVAKILSKIVRSLGIKLAVKVHPNESDEPFKKLAASGAFDLIPKTMPFADVIRDDDLVVTSYSTTFYDALLAGVPVIIFQDKRNFLGPYYERGLPHANNTRQLRSLLARVLSNGYDPKVFEIVKRPEPRSNPIQLLEMHFATRDAR